jgi:hypothetical protein
MISRHKAAIGRSFLRRFLAVKSAKMEETIRKPREHGNEMARPRGNESGNLPWAAVH